MTAATAGRSNVPTQIVVALHANPPKHLAVLVSNGGQSRVAAGGGVVGVHSDDTAGFAGRRAMSASTIEWTEQTWNPVAGCSIVSPGCTNCYAMKQAARIEAMGGPARYAGLTHKVKGKPVWTGKIALAPDDVLTAPLRRKKPTTYFVNSMSDLFHEDVPDAWIDRVFAVMALTPQHTYQVLTKRAARMRDYCVALQHGNRNVIGAAKELRGSIVGAVVARASLIEDSPLSIGPLPNVWLGVSTERQDEADERIPHLLSTPAAVRFISAEPLLGSLDLSTPLASSQRYLGLPIHQNPHDGTWHMYGRSSPHLDWVIVGGESGTGARPMHPDWARSLRDQCASAGVPFFFKQWGNWHPEVDRDRDDPDWRQPYADYREPYFRMLNLAGGSGFHGDRLHVMRSCSKKSAGRRLDGITHDAMPERRA